MLVSGQEASVSRERYQPRDYGAGRLAAPPLLDQRAGDKPGAVVAPGLPLFEENSPGAQPERVRRAVELNEEARERRRDRGDDVRNLRAKRELGEVAGDIVAGDHDRLFEFCRIEARPYDLRLPAGNGGGDQPVGPEPAGRQRLAAFGDHAVVEP